MTTPSRRRFLRLSAAAGATAALTGCLDAGDPSEPNGGAASPTKTRTVTATGTETATDAPTQSETETPTDNATATPASEAVAWRTSFDAAVETTPLVDGDRIFAGSAEGTVRAFGADGAVEWTHDVSRPVREFAVADGTLLLVSGSNEFGSEQTLHAIDAASGDERWTFGPTGWWLDVLATRDGTVYVGTEDDALADEGQTLYAVPVADGEPAWSSEIGDPQDGVATEDAVFVTSSGRLHAFDRADGAERWTTDVERPTYTTLAVVGDTAVIGTRTGGDEMSLDLLGFDVQSGTERWRFDEWTVTSTVAADGDLYVGGEQVVALDPASGSADWTAEERGFLGRGTVTDEFVFASGDAVRAFARDDGTVEWSWEAEPEQGGVSPAGVADGTLYLDAYHDGEPRNQYKFAVDVASGEGLWAFEDGTELTDVATGTDLAAVGGESGGLFALE